MGRGSTRTLRIFADPNSECVTHFTIPAENPQHPREIRGPSEMDHGCKSVKCHELTCFEFDDRADSGQGMTRPP
jgi:hypothetical protein